jgi:hypothetical protein
MAEFFASDVMKAIPEQTFTKKSRAFLEKEKELQERHQRILNLELAGIEKIPGETLRKCLLTIFREDIADEILSDPVKFKANGKKPIYLGWVYANCFMKPDGSFTPEKETFSLDFSDYELEVGGFHETGMKNLTYNVDFARMEQMAPYLKGVPV